MPSVHATSGRLFIYETFKDYCQQRRKRILGLSPPNQVLTKVRVPLLVPHL